MKVTVVTDKNGEIAGVMYGHAARPDDSRLLEEGPEAGSGAGLLAGPEQEIHLLDVSEKLASPEISPDLLKGLQEEVRKIRGK